MSEPKRIDVVRRAYQLWQEAGEPEGRDDEFYLQDEQELRNPDDPPPLRTSPDENSCPKCLGIGSVYENHPDRAWDDELGCTCGAGMPCKCNDSDPPDTSQVMVDEEDNATKH